MIRRLGTNVETPETAVDPAGESNGAGTAGQASEVSGVQGSGGVTAFQAERARDRVTRRPTEGEDLIDRLLNDPFLRGVRNFFIRLDRATDPDFAPPAVVVHDDLEPQFLVFGDSGTGDRHQIAVGNGMAKFCAGGVCKFALMTGDNFYRFGISSPTSSSWDDKFEKPYAKLDIPFFPTFGNHDHWGSTSAQIERSKIARKWKMPAPYHSFQVGHGATATEFFALDTEVMSAQQLQWLDEALAKSTARWKVVYGHHPVYSSGDHGGTPALERDLLPLLKKHGVDAYLAGHDHNLEVISQEGLLFAISGGGSQTRPLKEPVEGQEFAAESLGFMHVGIDAAGLRLRVMDQDAKVLFDKTFAKQGAAAPATDRKVAA